MLVMKLRQGIGLDIEYSDDIIHIVGYNEEEQYLAAFLGIIIKLPFLSVYIGEFEPLDWDSEEEE